MKIAQSTHLRVKRVAELTGISRQTLISWERRHGIIAPVRAANGYRYYSPSDVQLLQRVQELLASGHRIGEVAEILRNEGGPAKPDAHGLDWVRDELGAALRQFDAQRVHTLQARLVSVSFAERVDRVYMPLLIWIGDLWESGEASVAEEHNVSAYCRGQMLAMLTALDRPGGHHVVAAGFPGDHHENGLLAVAVKLALHGCSVTYVGANLPSEDVAQIAKTTQAQTVCQSVVMPTAGKDLAAHARDLVAMLPSGTLLAMGGPGIPMRAKAPDGAMFCDSLDQLYPHL
ncbi:MAG: MerR family transcriptional regulator [Proteobacteria bacterium]|nr:MerR family transcriptional regulator [Pseudomonadota bacterium]